MKNKTLRIRPQTVKKWTDLPFITCENSEGVGKWHIPKDMDYGNACRLGAVYAVYFMQYLHDNKNLVGSNFLGHLIQEIDLSDNTGSKGIHVGFFSTLERFLYSSTKMNDIWAWLEIDIAMSLDIVRSRALECLTDNVGIEIIEEV